jgi:hypothetical protein
MGMAKRMALNQLGLFKQLAYLPYITYLYSALGSFIAYHKGLKGNTV